jgi:hypothetical protein
VYSATVDLAQAASRAKQEHRMTENLVNKFFNLGLAFAAFFSFAGAASAAPDTATETRPVDARITRVRLDGIVSLKIRQGSPAALVLKGDPRWLARTTTAQSGDTLNIDTEVREARSHSLFTLHELHGVRAELTLPKLREVRSESLGSTEVNGFTGDELELTLEGAGSMKVWSNYRIVSANLGGIGSMHILGLDSEGIELNLSGAGVVHLSGRSKWLKADLGGLGGLDAQKFTVDTVNLDLSGLGNATVTAQQNCNLNLSGMGSVTVYGKPLNRKVAIDGLGKVSWK